MGYLGHYSFGLQPDLLQSHARDRVNDLRKKLPEDTVPILVFTGFSGIAFATALALEFYKRDQKVDMMLVRKQGEKSHGEPIHCSTKGFKDRYYIFVDDFISSGATFTRLNTVVSHYGGITLICEQEGVRYPTVSDLTPLPKDETHYYNELLRPKDVS